MESHPGLSLLVDGVLEGQRLSRAEALEVLSFPEERYAELVGEVSGVRRTFFGDRVKLNALVNVKSGLCPEDCNYCSQSKVSTAPIQKYPYLGTEAVMERADVAREAGAKRLCLVASGRGPTGREVNRFAETVREVKDSHPDLEVCACLGLLGDGQAETLKDAGVHAYNHNLNTSERVYGEICSTHNYADRQQTVDSAKRGGLSPCSGALFGMGETDADIVDVAFALRDLEPDSVPINFLIPIEGTPLGDRAELTPQRCLKILALFRLVFPDVEVRIAGGREVHLRSLQPVGLLLANSIFVGDYLTTEGQEEDADLRMISDAGLTVESAGEATLPRERGGDAEGLPGLTSDRHSRSGAGRARACGRGHYKGEQEVMDGRISEGVAREEPVYRPVHPGRTIELEWLEPLEISIYELAKTAGVPKQRMYALIRGERGISADTALRLSRTLGMPSGFWMGLQTDYALEMAEWEEGERIEKEARPLTTG